MKSNIKPKKFYAEADERQEDWEDYLEFIDDLKDKKANNDGFTLKDFCWTLYGDGHCSYTWEGFKNYILSTSKKHTRKYSVWVKAFKVWQKD